jgi:hypothetical protein
MTEVIEKVPIQMRWEIATKGLTAAYMACANALRDAVGGEKLDEFSVGLWSEAGRGIKEFADTIGLTIEDPRAIAEAMELLAVSAMGPEFEFEIVEATEDRSVGRTSKCPWHERWKELGLAGDFCSSGHQGWGDGAVESLSPDFSFKLTKNMVRGDPYCEWVVERKR